MRILSIYVMQAHLGPTALHLAIMFGQKTIVSELLKVFRFHIVVNPELRLEKIPWLLPQRV
jgi:hypothetical protein